MFKYNFEKSVRNKTVIELQTTLLSNPVEIAKDIENTTLIFILLQSTYSNHQKVLQKFKKMNS